MEKIVLQAVDYSELRVRIGAYNDRHFIRMQLFQFPSVTADKQSITSKSFSCLIQAVSPNERTEIIIER